MDELIPNTNAQALEDAILKIGEAMKILANSRLKWDTIVTLIHADTKVSKRDVEKVMKHLWKFDEIHLQHEVLRKSGYGILEELMVDGKPRLTGKDSTPLA